MEKVRVMLPRASDLAKVRRIIGNLATVCEEARCPNMAECWGRGSATVMILGKYCTRACRFCAVRTRNPRGVLDTGEPRKVADAVARSGLRYVVITSVDRDDLPDRGASHFGAVIHEIKARTPHVGIEALIPDYVDDELATVLRERPTVVGHNVETVRELTRHVRDHRASYEKSLTTLRQAAEQGFVTKSSLMLGLGETREQVLDTLSDLHDAGVSILTIGQYLRPTKRNLPVERYVPIHEFNELKDMGLRMGFRAVAAGPLVRSSYMAETLYRQAVRGEGQEKARD